MATTVEPMTELAMKLRLSQNTSERLSERAKKIGLDVSAVASDIIEQVVSQPSFSEAPSATDDENLNSAAAALSYDPVPARRSYTVQAVVAQRTRGVAAPFELDPE